MWTNRHETVTGLRENRVEGEARAVPELHLDDRLLELALGREAPDLRVDPADEIFVRACLPGRPDLARLEERFSARPRGCAEVRAAQLRHDPAARGALEEAQLEQVGLVDVLDRVSLLAERDGERRQPDRAAVEPLHDRPQQLAVGALEPFAVDLEQVERLGGDLVGDDALVPDLRDVADAAQDAVRDPRRPSRAPGDLVGGLAA